MTAVGELVLVLGLLVSAHCEVRARDPDVEEEEEELGGRGREEVVPIHSGMIETPHQGGTGNSPVQKGHKPQLTYRHKQKVFTSVTRRRCPGHEGPNCEDEVLDHQQDSGGQEPEQAEVHLTEHSVPSYPNVPAVLPVPDMMVLVQSQLQPILEGFNRSLKHLSQQVGVLTRDVAEMKSLQLEAGQREESEEDKLDQVFHQIEEVRRQMEEQHRNMKNMLNSQDAMLHQNLSRFNTDIDTKLKHHQKLLQVSQRETNTNFTGLKPDPDQLPDQKRAPSETATLWDAVTRLNNIMVNNTEKVDGLMEDMEVTSDAVEQLRQQLKVLDKQINQTARTSQVLFMETGLEVEQAKVTVQRQVEELVVNVTQYEQRLQEMDEDVDDLYTALYRQNSSSDCNCRGLKVAVAHLQRGVASVTELANENKLALEDHVLEGGAHWGGVSDWELVVETLQRGIQQVKESLVSEQSRTRTLDFSLNQLNSSISALQETNKQQEVQVKLLSASFRSLLEDAIRHSEVLQLLLGEEVLEFLEWPLQDKEAYSIMSLRKQLRKLQEQLRSHEEASDRGTGGREEVPSADQPSSSSLLDWLPGGPRRSSGGGPSRQNQLLLLPPEMSQHAGDGSDLWNLEKKVEELQQKLVQLEEKPCSCSNTPSDRETPPAGGEEQLQEEVMWLKRRMEDHLRVFRNADVLAASNETLELDKLLELVKRRNKKRGGRGGGRGRSRREEPDEPVLFDQSDGSLLFVGGSPQSISNRTVMFQPSLNRGQFYSSTGVFSAPVDGIYLFLITLDLRTGSAHVLLKRGKERGGALISLLQQKVMEAGPVSSVGLLLLSEGEEVRLKVRRGEWAESKENVFAGLLLHQTT